MTQKSVSIRLGTTGKAEVTRDFEEIAQSGDTMAKRYASSFKRAAEDVETAVQAKVAAMQRQSNAADKIAAIMPQSAMQMRIGDANGTGFGQWEGSARQSAIAFKELIAAQEQLEARAKALRASINPAAAAQDRFNAEMGEARALVSAGVISIDEYCAKLRQEQAILDTVSEAHKRGAGVVGAHGAAIQNIGFQAQDFFVQIGGGTSVLVAFAQQFPQAASAVAGLGGKMAGVARFAGGPWGIGITTAVAALAPFAGKLLETEKTLDDVVKKLREDAKETARTEQAKNLFGKTLEGVRQAIADQAKALKESAAAEQDAAERANIAAKAKLNEALATRQATAAKLDEAIAAKKALADSAFANTDPRATEIARRDRASAVADLEAKKKLADIAVADAEKAVNRTRVDLATDAAKRSSDPIAQINRQYDEQVAATKRAARAEADRGKVVDANLTRQLAGIERNRAAALDAEEKRQRAAERTGKVQRDTEAATADQIARMLRKAIPDVRVTSTTGGKHTKNSYHYRNQAIDFVPPGGMASMSKDDVRAIFKARGIEVLELLGPGDKGHSDHFHVAWAKGKASLDEFSDAARRAEERAQLLDALTGKYAPLTAATEQYRRVLADIAKLNPANVDELRAGARIEFMKTRAGLLGDRIGMDGIKAGAEAEQAGIDREDEVKKRAGEEQKRRADYAKATLFDQQSAIELARTELGLIAANDNAREASLAKVRLMLDLKREGIDLDSAEARQILANADTYDVLIGKLREQRMAWDELQSFGEAFVETVLSPETWKDWGDGSKAVLAMVRDEFIKLALLNPIRNLMDGGDRATLGSIIGTIGGLLGGRPTAAAGGSQGFVGPPGNAAGTHYWSGGDTLVGENGAEVVSLPRGSRVTPAGETRRLLAANDGGQRGNYQHFDLRGAVVTEKLYSDMLAIGDAAAVRGAAGGAQMGFTETKARAGRRLGRKW